SEHGGRERAYENIFPNGGRMKQKKQIIVLLVLVVVAVGVWGWQWWTPGGGGASNTAAFLRGYQPLNFPNPEIHWPNVEKRHKSEYKGSGVNPFSMVVPPSPEEVKKAADDA